MTDGLASGVDQWMYYTFHLFHPLQYSIFFPPIFTRLILPTCKFCVTLHEKATKTPRGKNATEENIPTPLHSCYDRLEFADYLGNIGLGGR
jgi:hypothetical protein